MIVVDRRDTHRPLAGLQRLITVVLIAVITTMIVAVYGVMYGAALTIFACVFALALGGVSWVQRAMQRLYRQYELRLVDMTKTWQWAALWAPSQVEDGRHNMTQAELIEIANRSGVLSPREQVQFGALLSAHHLTMHHIMVPVERIVSVADTEALGPLVLDDLHRSGYRQFPVIHGDIDHIVGVLYLDDIVDLKSSKATVRDALDPRVDYASPRDSVTTVLTRCLETRRSVVIVQGDDKSTVGLVTLRDMVTSLLGSL
ncbi:MAG: CBS domain-containing protein [Candidatus Saccharimonadales bacterium]